jgi:hypothetical protein
MRHEVAVVVGHQGAMQPDTVAGAVLGYVIGDYFGRVNASSADQHAPQVFLGPNRVALHALFD